VDWARSRFSLSLAAVVVFSLASTNRAVLSLNQHRFVVAQDGSGDFKTITQAIDALPMFNYQRVVIFIKNGLYNEKVRITQDYVTLCGESRDSTIIEYNQLRTDWISHKDAIGPAVVNIYADDVVLENLTIRNSQPQVGPHAFAVYGVGTRTIIMNCNVLSRGGDTVSLWNYKTGMYYCASCYFRGAVDFVCPRGWCYVRDSKFYELKKGAASLWHAGGYDIRQKFVVVNSSFDGVEGFELGRHHYEAQFYLINCRFSSALANTPIYRVTYKESTKNRPFNWGERDYYYNCHREGGDYSWFANNLRSAAGSPTSSEITPSWTFDNKWDPKSKQGPSIVKYEIHGKSVLFFFSEPITVIGKPIINSANGREFVYDSGAGSNTLRFYSNEMITKGDLTGLSLKGDGKLFGTIASVSERDVNLYIGNIGK